LEDYGFDEVWYDYDPGYYDGSGALLARKGEGFVLFDISHCSCYGPEDTIDMSGKVWEDFEALWGRLTESNRECCKTVFEAARKS
jgi:hypothetical protein